MHGLCSYIDEDGSSYAGFCKDGRKHGIGIFQGVKEEPSEKQIVTTVVPEPKVYRDEGCFVDDRLHGVAIRLVQ
jgi:hypothetical protein